MDTVLTIVNIGILIANIALICFIYMQVRHIYKPILTTKVLSRDASVDDIPTVLIYRDPYLVVSNTSNNRATKLNIRFEFWLKHKRIILFNKRLNYLNPQEAARELIPIGEIIQQHSELFEEVSHGNETKKIPKKTLSLLLKITVTHGVLRERITDSYEIEWGSLETYPNFKDHPMMNCWNRRDGIYIYKLRY